MHAAFSHLVHRLTRLRNSIFKGCHLHLCDYATIISRLFDV